MMNENIYMILNFLNNILKDVDEILPGGVIGDILRSTAWPMTPPKAYGPFHLGFVFIFGALSVILAMRCSKLSDKKFRGVLLGCGLFLIITEIYKISFYVYAIDEPVDIGQFKWWVFPFQLCSVPMYFCLLGAFLPEGKFRRAILDFMAIFNLMSGAIAFTEPSGLIHSYWTLTLHAFIWHMMLVFIGLMIGFSKDMKWEKKTYLRSVYVFLGLALVAFCINLIFWKASNGDINMFYVGPKNNPIFIFKDIAKAYGMLVCTPIYLFALCLGAFIFYLLMKWINSNREKCKMRKENIA